MILKVYYLIPLSHIFVGRSGMFHPFKTKREGREKREKKRKRNEVSALTDAKQRPNIFQSVDVEEKNAKYISQAS